MSWGGLERTETDKGCEAAREAEAARTYGRQTSEEERNTPIWIGLVISGHLEHEANNQRNGEEPKILRKGKKKGRDCVVAVVSVGGWVGGGCGCGVAGGWVEWEGEDG